jgi:hypothetical protein
MTARFFPTTLSRRELAELVRDGREELAELRGPGRVEAGNDAEGAVDLRLDPLDGVVDLGEKALSARLIVDDDAADGLDGRPERLGQRRPGQARRRVRLDAGQDGRIIGGQGVTARYMQTLKLRVDPVENHNGRRARFRLVPDAELDFEGPE